ncbi:MAG TPA: DUF4359 domain-containing protein [Rubricoccaceae bacterium]|nr:DUF4359 domain-containing protein [Rubricoccaceae bacterium]
MKFLFFLLIVLGTLALFNPNEEDFRYYVQERMTDTISDHARDVGGGFLGDIVGGVGGTLASALASRTVDRKNFLVFSLYTIDLNGADREGGEWRFLGVAKQFIPLEQPQL